jgi:hypothetical protein
MIALSSIKITPADFEKRKSENALDHVRTAADNLILDPAHKPELTKIMRVINESLARRLVYTDIMSVERMTLMREIRIINESIEKIECVGQLEHADRRDKRKEVTK